MNGARTVLSAGRASKKVHTPCFPLDVMRTPAFLIDRSLRVLKANSRGVKLVKGIRGPATIDGGRLRLRCPCAQDQLGIFVDGFFGTESEDEGHFVKPDMVLRLLRAEDNKVVLLSVRLASHQLRQVSASGVAKMLNLPEMQSRLVVALVNGRSIEKFARSARITERTGKHHLGVLLKKFECTSQTALVRKLCILLM